MSFKIIASALIMVLLVACTKKEEATDAMPAVVPTVSAVATQAVVPVASAVPTEVDEPGIVMPEELEAKAATSISASNLEAQLDELEKEIGKSE